MSISELKTSQPLVRLQEHLSYLFVINFGRFREAKRWECPTEEQSSVPISNSAYDPGEPFSWADLSCEMFLRDVCYVSKSERFRKREKMMCFPKLLVPLTETASLSSNRQPAISLPHLGEQSQRDDCRPPGFRLHSWTKTIHHPLALGVPKHSEAESGCGLRA